tara:strand:- start:2157 stop:2492 length:336 start_codon:yes stop_codon:yes gene_type:complete
MKEKKMRTDSNMENIKFLLDSMDLNETYMDDPRYYVPVFEKIVVALKPIVKSKDVSPQDFAVALTLYSIEMMFMYAPKKNVALYTLLDMIKAKLDMIRIEEGQEKDIDGEA